MNRFVRVTVAPCPSNKEKNPYNFDVVLGPNDHWESMAITGFARHLQKISNYCNPFVFFPGSGRMDSESGFA